MSSCWRRKASACVRCADPSEGIAHLGEGCLPGDDAAAANIEILLVVSERDEQVALVLQRTAQFGTNPVTTTSACVNARDFFAQFEPLSPEARVEMASVLERSAEQLHELSLHLAGVNRLQAADELARLERLYIRVARKLVKASTPAR